MSPGMMIPTSLQGGSIYQVPRDYSALPILDSLMRMIKEEMRETIGGLPYATGGMSNQDQQRTATETTALVSGTSTRFQRMIQSYEKNKLYHFLKMDTANDKQFMDEAIWVNDNNSPLSPDIIRLADVDYDVSGSRSIMMRNEESQALSGFVMNILPTLVQAGIAQLEGGQLIVDAPSLALEMMKSQRMKNVDTYARVVTEEEVMQEQQDQGAMLNVPFEMGGPQPGAEAIPPQLIAGQPRVA